MDVRSHLFNRREVVVIFIDMDPSMMLTDLAFPQMELVKPSSSSNQQPQQQQHDGGAAAPAAAVAKNNNNNRHGSRAVPQTRFDVVRAAVRSFLYQKERAAPDPQKLFFAMYGVWQDVVELLPPTPCTSGSVESALRQYLNKRTSFEALYAMGASPADDKAPATKQPSFPFHAVSNVLASLQFTFHATLKTIAATTTDGGRGAKPATADSFTVMEGFVLLSRPTAPPSSSLTPAIPSGGADEGSQQQHAAGWETRVHVVTLGTLQQPLTPLRVAQRRSSSEQLEVQYPCILTDPVAFTGVQHKGLAVGAAMTRLLAAHKHSTTTTAKGESAFSQKPLHQIHLNLTTVAPAHAPVPSQATAAAAAPAPSSPTAASPLPPPPLRVATRRSSASSHYLSGGASDRQGSAPPPPSRPSQSQPQSYADPRPSPSAGRNNNNNRSSSRESLKVAGTGSAASSTFSMGSALGLPPSASAPPVLASGRPPNPRAADVGTHAHAPHVHRRPVAASNSSANQSALPADTNPAAAASRPARR